MWSLVRAGMLGRANVASGFLCATHNKIQNTDGHRANRDTHPGRGSPAHLPLPQRLSGVPGKASKTIISLERIVDDPVTVLGS